jgi:site-specific DNA recombinase
MPRPRNRVSATRDPGRRCAIYTRKSSEEGLEQEFNSLDAQREACEAYARSQRHEGWTLLAVPYDDGGISGGTLQRPALQRLLCDIRAGKVDLVLVYKVDRLTRSLADFAKIVEALDAHSASFVSVTQQFNTATSMGRLTLNMLLSFAQFEREVAGERIRDKIAASKRKGMWMGGTVPLGYDVRDRKLVVNRAEAETVRHIFRRYAELGSVRLTGEELSQAGTTGKSGRPLARGPLFHLLQNRTYRGEIAHKGAVYPGEHAAIVDPDLWDSVRQALADSRAERTAGARGGRTANLLAGLVHDHAGEPMTATYAVKGEKRYRYYVSRRLIAGTREANPDAVRVPAGEIERLVSERLRRWLSERATVFAALRQADLLPPGAEQQARLLRHAEQLAKSWPELSGSQQRSALRMLVASVDVQSDRVDLHLHLAALRAHCLGSPHQDDPETAVHEDKTLTLSVPARVARAGKEITMLIEGASPPARIDERMIKLLGRAQRLREVLIASDAGSLSIFAKREGVSKSYITRLVRLTYLAPSIVSAILDGSQPDGLTASRLMQDTRLPLDWREQERLLRLR